MLNAMRWMCWSWADSCNQKYEHVGREFLTLFLVIVFTTIWFLYNKSKADPKLPPGPRGLPIVGYFPFLGTHLHKEFTELGKIYGPIYKLRLGNQLCVVISSPLLVKQVVREHDSVFANRNSPVAAMAASYGGNDIAYSPYGPAWKKMRKIFVSQMLSKSVLDSLYYLRRKEVKNSIRQVYGKIGKPVDVNNLVFLTVMNAAFSMLWGGSDDVDGDEFRNAAVELIMLLGKTNISDYFPWLARFDLQGIERKTKKVFALFHGIICSAIKQRIKIMAEAKAEGRQEKYEEKKDFLQFLLNLHENGDNETSITMNQVIALLTDIVVGGTDTTTTAVEWVFSELINNPEEMKRVQQELTQVVGLNNFVEEFHLSKLTYLDAVIKETFRLHPSLPLVVPRCPSESRTIGGYLVPKGATVFLNAWAIHRDANIWESPLEFRPQRFLNGPIKYDYHGNNFEYLPFGSGRRICAGLPLAERMLIYVLASFLHCFEWKMSNGTKLDLYDKSGILGKKAVPLVAIPSYIYIDKPCPDALYSS